MEELIRFNEAMDQILAESVARFTNKLDRDKDLFLAILGHDLRNPLNAITLSAAALKRSRSLTFGEHAVAQRIADSGRRMQRMVSDLLDFTRTRLGAHLPVRTENCNLEAIVRGVAGEVQVSHPDRPVAVTIDGDTAGLWDCNRITQLVSNLAGNAIQHGYPNSPIKVESGKRARMSTWRSTTMGRPSRSTISLRSSTRCAEARTFPVARPRAPPALGSGSRETLIKPRWSMA
ncbi:MAG: HAMP domain-containing sensor histidine kinase [Casimicrobiaceae bacterium]